MDWGKICTDVINFVESTSWLLVETIFVYLLCCIGIKIILKLISSAFKHSKMAQLSKTFLYRAIKYALYILLWLIVLQMLGVQASTFVAILSTLGIAIGLALKDSLSNLANGLIIISTQPFEVGDFITINGVEGKVKYMHMLTTTIVTRDNKEIIIPNSDVLTKSIVNHSALPIRRVDYHFYVAHESDSNQVFEVIKNAMLSDGRVLTDPKPYAAIDKINENNLDIFAFCWCDTEDYWDVFWEVQNTIYSELNRNNIIIPHKQVEVRMRTDDVKMINYGTLPQRVEKIRKQKSNNDENDDDLFLEPPDLDEITKDINKLTSKKRKKKIIKSKNDTTETPVDKNENKANSQ